MRSNTNKSISTWKGKKSCQKYQILRQLVHRITEHAELDRSHKNHWVHFLVLLRTIPKSHTMFLSRVKCGISQTPWEHDGWGKMRVGHSALPCFNPEPQIGHSTEGNFFLSPETEAKLKEVQGTVSWLLGNGYHSKHKLKSAQAKTSPDTFLIPALSGQQKAPDLLLVVTRNCIYWATKQGQGNRQEEKDGLSPPEKNRSMQNCLKCVWCD